MASVTLDRGWVHHADDPAHRYVQFKVARTSRRPTADAKVLQFGRRRIVRRTPARHRPVTVESSLIVERRVVDVLEAWAGDVVLYRDGTGTAEWGVYDQIEVTPLKGRIGWTVRFELISASPPVPLLRTQSS